MTIERNEDPDLLDKMEDKNMTISSRDDDEDIIIKKNFNNFNMFKQDSEHEDEVIVPLMGDTLVDDERSKPIDVKKGSNLKMVSKDSKPKVVPKQELNKPPVNMAKTTTETPLNKDNQSFYPSLLGKHIILD